LRKRQRRGGELASLQQAREAAEKARTEALQAELKAKEERDQYEQERLNLQREAEAQEELRLARINLKPGDPVRLTKIDQPGHIVRVDVRRNLAVVKAGLGQWEVPLEEVVPM
jgi:DNA mismatch repair protein MutS2